MFIDTHFHLGSDSYEDYQEVLNEARKNQVSPFIVSGCNRKEIEEVLKIASTEKDVYLTLGYHPDCADSVTDDDLMFLEEQIKNHLCVGVGEIGLDYHYGKENRDKQIDLFKKQLALAEKYKLPVVIHTRDAIQDTYDIIKEYKVIGVLHCFNESLEMAKAFLKLGFYFGIGGVVTFKNSKLHEMVRELPLEKILLETDSPYLAPEPYRGKKNGPWNIPVIAQRIADIKEITLEDVSKITLTNTHRLFDLTKKM